MTWERLKELELFSLEKGKDIQTNLPLPKERRGVRQNLTSQSCTAKEHEAIVTIYMERNSCWI